MAPDALTRGHTTRRSFNVDVYRRAHKSNSRLLKYRAGRLCSCRVAVVPADLFIHQIANQQPIRLAKIDTEGFEARILAGMSNLLASGRVLNRESCPASPDPRK